MPVLRIDRDILPDVIRALAIRGHALSGYAMSAIMDEHESPKDLLRKVTHG